MSTPAGVGTGGLDVEAIATVEPFFFGAIATKMN
jgi:hypothetical protein